MTIQSNIGAPTGVADPEDITIGELLDALGHIEDRPLVFSYDGREVQPGYHVTEVKAGQFAGLDCGGNPETWTEIFVQLWDVNEDRDHMAASKFARIISKVIDHVALDMTAKLTFEVVTQCGRCNFSGLRRRLSPMARSASHFRRAPQAASRAIAGWSSSNLPAVVPAPPAAEPGTLLPWSFR